MLLTRIELEKQEAARLAPYAMRSIDSRGRVHKEPIDRYRLPFQRDRARIVNSRSFRRLQAKTQVFVSSFGDHYRDRMTHTIEVSQIARDTSRALGLNEDLTECIALAHDIGHTPFGHGGEEVLNKIMQQYQSGFEHNEQSRRILEELEINYTGFKGLNLSKEVLDGLLKHNPHHYQTHSDFVTSPHLEAQIADAADEIAYTNHDVDDGLRSGFITVEQLRQFEIWNEAEQSAKQDYGKAIIPRVVSKMISAMVGDLQTTTDQNILKFGIDSIEKVRAQKEKTVTMSREMQRKYSQLRIFLFENLYYNKNVQSQIEKGKTIINDLFVFYMANHESLPQKYLELQESGEKLHIVVKDYIAGMTDHYAEKEWLKIHSK